MIHKDDASFAALFQAHPIPMWVYDLQTLAFRAVNDAAISHYGYSEQEFLGMTIRDIRPAATLQRLEQNLAQPTAEPIERSGVWQHVRKDGSVIDVEITSHSMTFLGRACRFVLAHDVSARVQAQHRVDRVTRIYAALSGVNAAIVRIRERGPLFDEVCRVAVREGGFSSAWVGAVDEHTGVGSILASTIREQAPALPPIVLTLDPNAPEADRPANVAMREQRTVICNDLLREPSLAALRDVLETGPHRAFAALPLIVRGRPVAVCGLFADARDYFDADQLRLLDDLANDLSFALLFMEQEGRLSYLAYYDALTGLPNANLFMDRLSQLLLSHQRDHGPVCVAVIDVVRFSQINESLGRSAGDALLKQVAQRLEACMQDTASVARIGSDTFGIALAQAPHAEQAALLLQQSLLGVFREPFRMGEQEVRLFAQAGIAQFPTDGEEAEVLFKHAELALKNAKSVGLPYACYAPHMNAVLSVKLELENDIQAALHARQFVMHYQPRVDLMTGEVVSAEALIRWQHPRRGLVGPVEFVPLAEESGLIVPIGAWVIGEVCAQQARWRSLGVPVVPVAVNLSPAQCRHGHVLHTIQQALAMYELDPSLVEFELTETAVMDDPDEATRLLEALKGMGMRLALDDFGTGYSSLVYLKRYPFDFVKIDRAFVTDLTRSPEDAAIATAVIAMSHSLKLRVVAEGVETAAQMHFLHRLGCDEMQGYFFSPPVPAEQFAGILRSNRRMELPETARQARHTLLLVDDEPHNLSSLSRLLRREGYQILTATGGEEALKLLALHRVQVIVSDQRMPGMTGSELFSIVKELYPDTIRIILSGYTALEAVTDSINQGAVFKFLTKPWDDELLREHIRDAFRRYRPT